MQSNDMAAAKREGFCFEDEICKLLWEQLVIAIDGVLLAFESVVITLAGLRLRIKSLGHNIWPKPLTKCYRNLKLVKEREAREKKI